MLLNYRDICLDNIYALSGFTLLFSRHRANFRFYFRETLLRLFSIIFILELTSSRKGSLNHGFVIRISSTQLVDIHSDSHTFIHIEIDR